MTLLVNISFVLALLSLMAGKSAVSWSGTKYVFVILARGLSRFPFSIVSAEISNAAVYQMMTETIRGIEEDGECYFVERSGK